MSYIIENNNVITYYDNIAKIYDGDRFGNSYGRFIHHQETRVLDTLQISGQGCVLDLACGTGRFLKYAQIGADASVEMLKVARQKYPEKELHLCDAQNLPFEDNTIDTILCFHLFMHLDAEKVPLILQECHRVLKKNGRLIFDLPSQKRRKLLRYKKANWHGAYCSQPEVLLKLSRKDFTIGRSFGILLLPIHQLPKAIRPFCLRLDHWLSNSILKPYSSYIITEFVKK